MAWIKVVAAATEETGENAHAKITGRSKLRNLLSGGWHGRPATGSPRLLEVIPMSCHRNANLISQPPPELEKRTPVHEITARTALVGAAGYGLEELEKHKEHA